jgi:hypothetical protein
VANSLVSSHVIPCHPCTVSKQNSRFCSMKYVQLHPVPSHVILGHFLSKMVLQWSESSVMLCHPMSSLGNHILNFKFFCRAHGPVSSYVIPYWLRMLKVWQPISFRKWCCSKVSLVLSCVIPCHPWAFPIKNCVFLQGNESSVILWHPMSSLENHILYFMFFAGHMVRCHPVSPHIYLEAISMQMAC